MNIYKVGIPEISIGPIASKLKSSLYLGPVMWLIPGGSNIKIAVAVMDRIDSGMSQNLIIGLTDERYGVYNHPDSNWRQLMDSGFDAKNARLIETLRPESEVGTATSLEDTIKRYNDELETAMEGVETIVGQFGMGSDGHIAGILPSSAATQEVTETITGYQSEPFTRITLTFNGIRRLSEAFLVVMGSDKHDAIDRLIHQNLPLTQMPAQIIKQVREAYVYNDQMEGA